MKTTAATTTSPIVSEHVNSGGLGTGAKIGIGVAVLIGVIALVAGLIWWNLRGKRTSKRVKPPWSVDNAIILSYRDLNSPNEMEGSPFMDHSPTRDLEEAPETHRSHELDAIRPTWEIASTSPVDRKRPA